MPLLFTLNEKPAARTNRDGLDFARTTTAPPNGKDDTNVNIHPHAALFKPRR